MSWHDVLAVHLVGVFLILLPAGFAGTIGALLGVHHHRLRHKERGLTGDNVGAVSFLAFVGWLTLGVGLLGIWYLVTPAR